MNSPSLLLAIGIIASSALSKDTYTDQEARQVLSQNGISVNKPHPATSLNNIRVNTINQVVNLKKSSNCDIVVTAGTESSGGHKTSGTKNHGTGYKVDIRLNSCITNYIKKTFPYSGKRSNDNADMYKNGGIVYALEKDHWDILYP